MLTLLANCDKSDGLVAIGQLENFARSVLCKAAHLMDHQVQRSSLHAQMCNGLPEIVDCSAIGCTIFSIYTGNRQNQQRCRPSPNDVALVQAAQCALKGVMICARNGDKVPWLTIPR